MAADAGPAASSASSLARMGSRETAAASGSSITVTSSMGPPSHRTLFLSRRFEFSVGDLARNQPESMVVPADRGALQPRPGLHALPAVRGRADPLPRRGERVEMGLGALPFGVVEDAGAVGAEVEVGADATGVRVRLVLQRVEDGVHPGALPVGVGPVELDVDDHDAAGDARVTVPGDAAVVPVAAQAQPLDVRNGGVDLVHTLLPVSLDEGLVGLLARPLRVVHQGGGVVPPVEVIAEQAVGGPGPPLPDGGDVLDGLPRAAAPPPQPAAPTSTVCRWRSGVPTRQ